MKPVVKESPLEGWMETLLDDPEVFRGASGGKYRREDFSLKMAPEGATFFGVFDEGNPVGFFTAIPSSDDRSEIHTTMGKSARGKVAIDAMGAVLSLLKQKGVATVDSFCYKDSPHTIWFAKKCGFHTTERSTDINSVHVEICLS